MVDIVIRITSETYEVLEKQAKKENKTVKYLIREILAKKTNTIIDPPIFKPYIKIE